MICAIKESDYFVLLHISSYSKPKARAFLVCHMILGPLFSYIKMSLYITGINHIHLKLVAMFRIDTIHSSVNDGGLLFSQSLDKISLFDSQRFWWLYPNSDIVISWKKRQQSLTRLAFSNANGNGLHQ